MSGFVVFCNMGFRSMKHKNLYNSLRYLPIRLPFALRSNKALISLISVLFRVIIQHNTHRTNLMNN